MYRQDIESQECTVCKVRQPLTYFKPAKVYDASGNCHRTRGKVCKVCRAPDCQARPLSKIDILENDLLEIVKDGGTIDMSLNDLRDKLRHEFQTKIDDLQLQINAVTSSTISVRPTIIRSTLPESQPLKAVFSSRSEDNNDV